MNRHSNQEIPFFPPPMNISNPLCFTGILPYANISKVKTRIDHFFDPIKDDYAKECIAAQLVIQNYSNNPEGTFTQ